MQRWHWAALTAAGFLAAVTISFLDVEEHGFRRSLLALAATGVMFTCFLTLAVDLYWRARVDRRVASEMKHRASEEAERNSQARAAMLGMVSHELRTPLQAMLGAIELLEHETQTRHGVILVGQLGRMITELSGRLDNLEQYTRLTSGKSEIRRAPFLLRPLLEKTILDNVDDASQSGHFIDVKFGEGLEDAFEGDAIRLRQILQNFVSNAIKYAHPGTIVITASRTAHAFDDGVVADAAEIAVTNDGVEIPEKERETIWEPFVRGRLRRNRQSGSGLGLAVVRLLATTASWDVGLRCDNGKTTFFVLLPINKQPSVVELG